jgi:hypothetical protein
VKERVLRKTRNDVVTSHCMITMFGNMAARYDVNNKRGMVFRLTPHDALGSRSGQVIDILLTALKPIKCWSNDG